MDEVMRYILPSSKRLMQAFNDGATAASKGRPLRSNPFSSVDDKELWLEWRMGFLRTLVAANENEEAEEDVS